MLTAYPVAGKRKCLELCEAFIEGSGGTVASSLSRLNPGSAFFYGVDGSNVKLWNAVRSNPKQDWYYCDNSYFDSTRQVYFRVTKNRLQHSGLGQSTGERFRALGISIRPWSMDGNHVIVCPQSEAFMRDVIGFRGDWLAETVSGLRSYTKREIRVRLWDRNKSLLSGTLEKDLVGAFALVTWSSTAAVTAALEGVPIVCSASCAAMPLSGQIYALHTLPKRNREIWAGVLADNQWTLAEFRNGTAWRALNDG